MAKIEEHTKQFMMNDIDYFKNVNEDLFNDAVEFINRARDYPGDGSKTEVIDWIKHLADFQIEVIEDWKEQMQNS